MTKKQDWYRLLLKLRKLIAPQISLQGREAFHHWLQGNTGQRLQASQQRLVKHLLGQLGSGYHFLMMGDGDIQHISENTDFSHYFRLGEKDERPVEAYANDEELPLPSDIIDAVMLVHALEYAHNPHRVLHEASRVLMPSGYLAIVVFNPVSLYGCYALLRRVFSKKPLWQRHHIRRGRLLDWLKLLHLQPVAVGGAGFFLPDKLKSRLSGFKLLKQKGVVGYMPFGAYHVIVAKKVVGRPLSPTIRSWQLVTNPEKAGKGLASHQVKRKGIFKKQRAEKQSIEKPQIEKGKP